MIKQCTKIYTKKNFTLFTLVFVRSSLVALVYRLKFYSGLPHFSGVVNPTSAATAEAWVEQWVRQRVTSERVKPGERGPGRFAARAGLAAALAAARPSGWPVATACGPSYIACTCVQDRPLEAAPCTL